MLPRQRNAAGSVQPTGRQGLAQRRFETGMVMHRMVSRSFTIAVIAGSLALAGCNTVRGFGKDLGSAGAALETVN
jgi:predicted small secreted protein